MVLSNKKYFIDQVNSSKAYQFISMYHYSHKGFKKAILNLGVYNKVTNELVGVLQWGHSANENIRLNRYVKEKINIEEYLELNRFAMADSEERNSESQAISLGIKWIKQNRSDIKLLVSYAGRVEGNYGYIYQATNWEYLGYFISDGFFEVDGDEIHRLTLSLQYKKNKNTDESFKDYLCRIYNNIAQYDSKQFIYIQRIDHKLTPATPILKYPKPSTDYPIQTHKTILKRSDIIENKTSPKIEKWYYNPNEQLFSTACLKRRGVYQPMEHIYLVYDKNGKLENTFNNLSELCETYKENYSYSIIHRSIIDNKKVKEKYFKKVLKTDPIKQKINVNVICYIDNKPFYKQIEIAKYVGVSRQAVSECVKRKGKTIGGKAIEWEEN